MWGSPGGTGTQLGIWAWAETCSLRDSGDPHEVPGKGSKRGLVGLDPAVGILLGAPLGIQVGIQVRLGLVAVSSVRRCS